MVITFSPANPKFKDWIAEDLPILHEEPRLKKLIPKIDVVTRQAPNIAKKTIRSRHWKTKSNDGPPPLPPGNYKLHYKNCVTCRRMEELGYNLYCIAVYIQIFLFGTYKIVKSLYL